MLDDDDEVDGYDGVTTKRRRVNEQVAVCGQGVGCQRHAVSRGFLCH